MQTITTDARQQVHRSRRPATDDRLARASLRSQIARLEGELAAIAVEGWIEGRS
jgi:hypothetical protein